MQGEVIPKNWTVIMVCYYGIRMSSEEDRYEARAEAA